ncbi:hypothetical protein HYH03_002935 [Edaphochlamys debaryana]|uniref:Uncharacterized protein n=1 Tax=Edaphochlamys debaryana TaxID=47281 RepID=A0A836C402_9CHLO|nr:hypothetical protein HYH03_002935 [Edaphochlamys debaryana]|eukprot:KAG2499360.1 hypothetical protein HYH03_002935 [Edaphochlamys debaryana]
MGDRNLDDSSDLEELVQRFMLPREGERHGETRSGAYRPKPVQLAAAAERNYPLLWPHLVRLRQEAEGAAEAEGARASTGGGGAGEGAARTATKRTLLQALRVLQEFEGMAGAEPGPRDTALGRLVPAYAAAVAADRGAEDMAPADVVHLTAEEVDLEAAGEGEGGDEGADEGAGQAPKRRRVAVKQEPGV